MDIGTVIGLTIYFSAIFTFAAISSGIFSKNEGGIPDTKLIIKCPPCKPPRK